MKKAIVLLSGGLDSSTVLHFAVKKGYKCSCLIFDYGQKHKKELSAAKRIAQAAKSEYKIVKIKLPWSGGALTDNKQRIPVNLPLHSARQRVVDLPSTYVPGRNTIFLSFALSYAEAIKASVVFIGANAVDYSGYPDCRPRYFNALNKVLKALGTGVKINVPLLKLTKAEIISLGVKLKVPYQHTWSCYMGGKKPCGKCDSCRFRAKGFKQAGVDDPLI